MRLIDTLSPGTHNEAAVVVDGGVLFLVFKATGEKRPASKETCAKYAHEETPAQREARKGHLDETVAQYREARAAMTPEQRAEEIAEMRASFGPGGKVVNVITGEITQL